MVSNQVLGARLAAGLLIVCGRAARLCAHAGTAARRPPPQRPLPPASSDGRARPGAEMTATEAAIAAGSDGAAQAARLRAPRTRAAWSRPSAPKHYIGEARRHPLGHRLDVPEGPVAVAGGLDHQSADPQPAPDLSGRQAARSPTAPTAGRRCRLMEAGAVRLDPRLRSEPLENAIPTIPYSAIAAFLSRPTVMTARRSATRPTCSPSATCTRWRAPATRCTCSNLRRAAERALHRHARRASRCVIRMTASCSATKASTPPRRWSAPGPIRPRRR